MVHNGIEYGLMAAYAEGLNVRSTRVGAGEREADAETTCAIRSTTATTWPSPRRWRCGDAGASWRRLLDLTAAATFEDPELAAFGGGCRIPARAGGRYWRRLTSVPVHVLSAALFDRFESRAGGRLREPSVVRDAQAVRGHAEKTS